MEPVATQYLAPAGYASLECDARGHGASEGLFGLDGPRDVHDTRELFTWLTARPEISDTQIGALGISLGGGAVWNAPTSGIPFKAAVPIITWTNLLDGARAARPVEVRPRAVPRGARSDEPLGPAVACSVGRPHDERRPDDRRRSRCVSLSGGEAPGDHDADAAHPGPPRLPLRHRPGARCVQVTRTGRSACTSATSATRRRRTPPRRAADVLRRSREMVRPVPPRRVERRRGQALDRARATIRGTESRRRTRRCPRRRRSR